jgi:hypothetical protein
MPLLDVSSMEAMPTTSPGEKDAAVIFTTSSSYNSKNSFCSMFDVPSTPKTVSSEDEIVFLSEDDDDESDSIDSTVGGFESTARTQVNDEDASRSRFATKTATFETQSCTSQEMTISSNNNNSTRSTRSWNNFLRRKSVRSGDTSCATTATGTSEDGSNELPSSSYHRRKLSNIVRKGGLKVKASSSRFLLHYTPRKNTWEEGEEDEKKVYYYLKDAPEEQEQDSDQRSVLSLPVLSWKKPPSPSSRINWTRNFFKQPSETTTSSSSPSSPIQNMAPTTETEEEASSTKSVSFTIPTTTNPTTPTKNHQQQQQQQQQLPPIQKPTSPRLLARVYRYSKRQQDVITDEDEECDADEDHRDHPAAGSFDFAIGRGVF